MILIAVPCLTVVVIFAANTFTSAAQVTDMPCCSLAAGSCRNECSQISLVDLGANAESREQASRRLLEYCSVELEEFWKCVNSTLEATQKNGDWVGRRCCHVAQSRICSSTCASAGARVDLESSCRQSDELEFFSCLEEGEEGERCCSEVASEICKSACKEIFHKRGKLSTMKSYGNRSCSHQMPECLRTADEAKSTDDPRQYLHCCDEATNTACSDTCRNTLRTVTTLEEIFDALEEKCGRAKPHTPIWRCFLQGVATKPTRTPLDAGKLSCCSRAASSDCQNLCWRAFQADWGSAWLQLDAECLSSPIEGELRRCLDDVDDPCEIGCSGLGYCTRYNNNPTTLFRSCSAAADEAAKLEADHWSQGGIIRGLEVAVRAAPSCPAETLRAAACFLQLRPCESRVHETRLCRDDCLELMTSCVEWTNITGPHTAASLCTKLSPPGPDMPCVSLKPYLQETSLSQTSFLPAKDVTTPCTPNPCPQGQVCVLQHGAPKLHRCQPGCSLGEMSRQMVPMGTWIQVPRVDQQGCLEICKCTPDGFQEKDCQSLNCFPFNGCWIQNKLVTHRSDFYLECNPCSCFEGEVTCSRRSCGGFRLANLPCDCPPSYVPVCSKLGVTFASVCLAGCARFSLDRDVEFGSCSANDPCASQPCGSSKRCVRRPRVCLSALYDPCTQYECVSLDCDPHRDSSGPVCDRDNRQYVSLCAMIRAGATLGYRGPCLRGCSLRGPVCGIDGEVYSSECAAWAARIIVDYFGPCVAVGLIGDVAKAQCEDAVQCMPLADSSCIGVTPPGACCPVCGGAARLFYSRKQMDRFYHVMKQQPDREAVTLEALLTTLSRQLQVAECALRGMMTPDLDIFIINQPLSRKPSALQQKACIAEIVKLVTRISEKSPRIMAEVPLGSLTRAEIAHGRVSGSVAHRPWFTMIFIIIVLPLGTPM